MLIACSACGFVTRTPDEPTAPSVPEHPIGGREGFQACFGAGDLALVLGSPDCYTLDAHGELIYGGRWGDPTIAMRCRACEETVSIRCPPDDAFHARAHVHVRCPSCSRLHELAAMREGPQGVWGPR